VDGGHDSNVDSTDVENTLEVDVHGTMTDYSKLHGASDQESRIEVEGRQACLQTVHGLHRRGELTQHHEPYLRSVRSSRVKCTPCNAPAAETIDGDYVCVECGKTVMGIRDQLLLTLLGETIQ